MILDSVGRISYQFQQCSNLRILLVIQVEKDNKLILIKLTSGSSCRFQLLDLTGSHKPWQQEKEKSEEFLPFNKEDNTETKKISQGEDR